MEQDEYCLKCWSQDNFIVDSGVVKINYGSKPSLLEIVETAKKNNLQTPILIRFPHLIEKQVNELYSTFEKIIKQENYQGKFQAVFPLKVNQYSGFLNHFLKIAKKFNYGVEAGSKAELLLAISINTHKAPITVNGFKDKEMIELGFLAAQMGHTITLIIESLNELKDIIKIASKFPTMPYIGIRARLYSYGSGTWAKSGGIDSKFGLTANELIQALKLLKQTDLIKYFKMLHFHIGSQISSIHTVQKALREVGQIYTELKKMGATSLNKINIGGGLGVEYNQHHKLREQDYTSEEFISTIVKLLKEITDEKNIENPIIYTEFGRYISASHSVLVTSVLELFSQDYQETHINLKQENPKLINLLTDILEKININLSSERVIELLHETIEHLDSIETLFELGYLDLQDRANIEILGNLIIKKILEIIDKKDIVGYNKLLHKIEERYLVNLSIFQSMPDFWGLNQQFPIMPIHHLNQKAVRPASLWDITCDSDGEIEFNEKAPLFLHNINLKNEPYYLGFFLLGAYQDILGMKHNLFDKPNEIVVEITEDNFKIIETTPSKSLINILTDVGFSKKIITEMLEQQSKNNKILQELKKYFNKINYL